jgi:hypothetical protein
MDTETLVRLVKQCRAIAFHEGGAKTHGENDAMIPLLHAALRGENPEEIKKAILGYESQQRSTA